MAITREARAIRGERSGSIICHTCDDNKEGFCDRQKRWCYLVRKNCDKQIIKGQSQEAELMTT